MAYYVIGEGNNLFESMTKEEILTAIAQAISTGTISDVDTGFITTIKEQNKNKPLLLWVGTEAEFNAIETKQPNCLYIKTDDSTLETIAEQLAEINNINAYLSRQNKVLWEGAVNDDSTDAQKLITANDIGSYNLIALEVSSASSGGTAVANTTILAYRSIYYSDGQQLIRFAGNNKTSIMLTEDYAAIRIENDNQCRFQYAFRDTNGTQSNMYLRKIIGVM